MTIQLHIVVLAVLAVAAVLALVFAHLRFTRTWALRQGKRNPRWTSLTYDKDDLPSWWVRGTLLLVSPILVLTLLASLVPFNPAYWVLTQHTGTIATLSNRFVDGTGDLTDQTYTLTLEGENLPLVVDDSRITGLKVGDHVTLTCSLQWVYAGADITNCYLRSF